MPPRLNKNPVDAAAAAAKKATPKRATASSTVAEAGVPKKARKARAVAPQAAEDDSADDADGAPVQTEEALRESLAKETEDAASESTAAAEGLRTAQERANAAVSNSAELRQRNQAAAGPVLGRSRPAAVPFVEAQWQFIYAAPSLFAPGIPGPGCSPMAGFVVTLPLSRIPPNTVICVLGGSSRFDGSLSFDDPALEEHGLLVYLGARMLSVMQLDDDSSWHMPGSLRVATDDPFFHVCTKAYAAMLADADASLRRLTTDNFVYSSDIPPSNAKGLSQQTAPVLTSGSAAARTTEQVTFVNSEKQKLDAIEVGAFAIMCGGKTELYSTVLETSTKIGSREIARLVDAIQLYSVRNDKMVTDEKKLFAILTCNLEGNSDSLSLSDFLPARDTTAQDAVHVAWARVHDLFDAIFHTGHLWADLSNLSKRELMSLETRYVPGVNPAFQAQLMSWILQKLSLNVRSLMFFDKSVAEQTRIITGFYDLTSYPNSWKSEYHQWSAAEKAGTSSLRKGDRAPSGQRSTPARTAIVSSNRPGAGSNSNGKTFTTAAKTSPALRPGTSPSKGKQQAHTPHHSRDRGCLKFWLHSFDAKYDDCADGTCSFSHRQPWCWPRSSLRSSVDSYYARSSKGGSRSDLEEFIDDSYATALGDKDDDKRRVRNSIA